MNFNICILPTSIHTQCFVEVADSIEWALKELGHEVSRGSTIPDVTNILFGLRPGDASALPPGSVIYNGEQVNKDGMWPLLAPAYAGHTIWDYSYANGTRYEEWGLPRPQAVRPGYAPVLDGRIPSSKKLVDVVFFGSMNERRKKILDRLQDLGLKVMQVPFGVYGKERDELVAQAKLCINIHYYESSVFEAVRCSYLAQNGVPVLTEESVASENLLWGIPGAPYDSLADLAYAAMQREEEHLIKQAQIQSTAARQVSLIDDVRAAVEALEVHERTAAVIARVQRHLKRPGPELTLCMIVKNESAVIERCLASVKPRLSRWCIVDTGSTDGTQEIIRKFMADLPGQLHECSWKEYDGSRNEALDLARIECKNEGWLLLIDADEIAHFENEFELPVDEGYDCYDAWFRRPASAPWGRPMFVRANKPWYFVLPRHEGLYCREHAPTRERPLESLVVLSTYEGARAQEAERDRFLTDAKVLETWISKNPGHFAMSRAVYYAAQSYRCAGHSVHPHDRALLQKAVVLYLKRAEMGGYAQEVFTARYLAAQDMVECGYPWERIQQAFLQAYATRTSRAEPLYNIARYYRVQGDEERAAGREASGYYALAELFARRAVLIGPSSDHFDNVDHTVNDWRAKDELATALTYLSGHAEARDLNRHILQYQGLEPHERRRIEANLAMCIRVAPDPGSK